MKGQLANPVSRQMANPVSGQLPNPVSGYLANPVSPGRMALIQCVCIRTVKELLYQVAVYLQFLLMKLLQLQQLKQIDMEHDMLSGGLEMVELARSVYLRRIDELAAQRKYVNDSHLSQASDYVQ